MTREKNKRTHYDYYKKIKKQKWKNNLLGIISIIFMIMIFFDVGGIVGEINHLLVP